MKILDTNVICNYLTDLNSDLHLRAKNVIENGEDYYISDIIIFETVFVLEIRFKFSRKCIAKALIDFIRQSFIHVDRIEELILALLLWEEKEKMKIDFADCLIVERARGKQLDGIVSFDKHFSFLPCRNIKP